MVMRNVHSHKSTKVCDRMMLALSYGPCLIAIGIAVVTIYPYWSFFVHEQLWWRAGSGSSSERALYYYSMLGGLILWGMLAWSYFAAVFTSPGYVDPDPWQHPPQPANADPAQLTPKALQFAKNPNIVTETTRTGDLRYCTKCTTYKPDNCHHCSECAHCVLGMDHHCPWINNCVGEGNQKQFTLFITYVPLAGLHMVFTVVLAYYVVENTVFGNGTGYGLSTRGHGKQLQQGGGEHLRHPDLIHGVFIMVSTLASAVIGLVLGGFAMFQWCLMSAGSSTLEEKFGKTRISIASAAEEGDATLVKGDKTSNTFYQKRMKNLRIVMGDSIWRWMLPIPASSAGFTSVSSNVVRGNQSSGVTKGLGSTTSTIL